ncbi:MAG: hypothetical protein ISS23_03400 [Nanoarchaeota archaeon]|nr:hypothetical protein [Nanoarchaeota archaeon]
MRKQTYISDGLRKLLDNVKARIDKAKQVKKEGGNKFQQLEARLTDEKNRKVNTGYSDHCYYVCK